MVTDGDFCPYNGPTHRKCAGHAAMLKNTRLRWGLISRYGHLGMAWYTPTAVVPGRHSGFLPVAEEHQRTISMTALRAASQYAAQNRSESLLVWHAGKLQLAEYWLDTQAASLVNSRSMHKMLGGLLVGRAVQLGHIDDLDDPVTAYIPAWRGTEKAAMTVRHVLQMSSGLRWFNPEPNPFGVAVGRYLDPHWDRVLLN